jgi:hypothetical protein
VDEEPLQRELEQMSGSPVFAKKIKESLQRLAGGAAGPELAEMAREVLNAVPTCVQRLEARSTPSR